MGLLLVVLFIVPICQGNSEGSTCNYQKAETEVTITDAVQISSKSTLNRCSLECCGVSQPLCHSFSFNTINRTCTLSSYPGNVSHQNTDVSVSLIQTYTLVTSGCKENYLLNPYTESCYGINTDSLSHAEAMAYCEGMGENLASFLTLESVMWMQNIMQNLPAWHHTAWIGLLRDSETGNYSWHGKANSTLDYDFWGGGDPNELTSCVLMYRPTYGFLFADISCDGGNIFPVVCESAYK